MQFSRFISFYFSALFVGGLLCISPVSAFSTPTVAQPTGINATTPIPGLFVQTLGVCPAESVSVGYTFTGGLYKNTCITIQELKDKLNVFDNYPLGCSMGKVAYGISGDNRMLICRAARSPGDCGLNPAQISELNTLTGQNKTLEQWCNTTSLSLLNKNLSSVPTGVYRLRKLESLDLSINYISSLSGSLARESIGRLVNLQTLKIQNNYLRTLPADFGNLKKLDPVLNLSYNTLQSLPESIGDLTQLTSIDISRNLSNSYWPWFYGDILQPWNKPSQYYCQSYGTFGTLPDSMRNLVNLKSFDARCSGIQSLGEGFGELNQITNLQLIYNRLSKLPSKIGDFSYLSGSMNLSNNYLTALPESFGNLNITGTLNLENNRLITIPSSLSKLNNIIKLFINNNQLTGFPDSFGQLTNLEYLYAQNQSGSLKNISELSFSGLTNLKELHIYNVGLEKFPESLGYLPNLTLLAAHINKLTTLPESFGNLSKLQRLFINNNTLTTLPSSFRDLQSLRCINADNQVNQSLGQLPEGFFVRYNPSNSLSTTLGDVGALNTGDYASCTDGFLSFVSVGLTSLPDSFGKIEGFPIITLHNNKLSTLPDVFDGPIKNTLITLVISSNGITSLPNSIGKLKNLVNLAASDTKISTLPSSFGDLSSLSTLAISSSIGEGIMTLPDEFSKLTTLSSLNLSGHRLNALPNNFGDLSALQALYLTRGTGSGLLSLPESFGNLTNLSTLQLNGNTLTSLPESFGSLSRLNQLSLSSTKLQTLPDTMVNLRELRYLYLNGNSALGNLNNTWISNDQSYNATRQQNNITTTSGSLRISLVYGGKIIIQPGYGACDLQNFQIKELNDLTGENKSDVDWCTGTTSINLSGKQLTDSNFPSGLSLLRGLINVDLSNNRLTRLPSLSSPIQNINLSQNNFIRLPSIGSFLLKNINLSHNQIAPNNGFYTIMSDDYNCWSNTIESIDLSHNQLTAGYAPVHYTNNIGWTACTFPSLQRMDFSYNNITQVFFHNPSLTSLDYSNNKISFLYDELSSYKKLKYLNLSGTGNATLGDLSALFESTASGSTYAEKVGVTGRDDKVMSIRNKGDMSPLEIKVDRSYDNECGLTEAEVAELNTFLYNSPDMLSPRQICATATVGLFSLGSNKTSIPESFGKLKNLEYVDLSANNLTSLPSSFSKLTKLTTLKLNRNRFTTFPIQITNLPNLTTLYIGNSASCIPDILGWNGGQPYCDNSSSRNYMTTLPSEIKNLTKLQTLTLNGIGLKSLPEDMDKLVNLISLDLQDNNLIGLPEHFGNLTNLVHLNLERNQLISLSNDFGNLTKLNGGLNLAGQQLIELPPSFGNLRILSLDLSGNNLTELPVGFGGLSNLQSLTILNNRGSSFKLSNDFGQLSNLQKLNIQNSNLTTIPTGFGNLDNLTEVYLRNNKISSLPDDFGGANNIQILDIGNDMGIGKNALITLPDSFTGMIKIVSLKLENNKTLKNLGKFLPSPPICAFMDFSCINSANQKKDLYLHNNAIQALPENFGDLKLNTFTLYSNQLNTLPDSFYKLNRSSLDLHDNSLTHLPESFSGMTQLSTLDLSDNTLNSLPLGIGNLRQLQILKLDTNQLTQLPDSFGQLTALRELDLFSNKLGLNVGGKGLPESFGKLTSLQTLNLAEQGGNISGKRTGELEYLPESFSGLTQLQALNLYRSGLKKFPDSIVTMSNIRSIDAPHNQIESLPEGMSGMTKLSDLQLANNPDLTKLPSTFDGLSGRLTNLNLKDTGLGDLSKNFDSDISAEGNQTNITVDGKSITIKPDRGVLLITKE